MGILDVVGGPGTPTVALLAVGSQRRCAGSRAGLAWEVRGVVSRGYVVLVLGKIGTTRSDENEERLGVPGILKVEGPSVSSHNDFSGETYDCHTATPVQLDAPAEGLDSTAA